MAWHAVLVAAESPELYPGDIKSVLLREEQIQTRIAELGAQIGADYRELSADDDLDLLLITVLKGAVMFVTDLARAIPLPTRAAGCGPTTLPRCWTQNGSNGLSLSAGRWAAESPGSI